MRSIFSLTVTTGTVCQIKDGQELRNLGQDDMIVLTIYDPPPQVH